MSAPALARPQADPCRSMDPWRLDRYVRGLRLTRVDVAGRAVTAGMQKRVLLVLKGYADPDGTGARPKMATLASDCETDERTARRAVRALELGGHLVTLIGGRTGQNGRRTNRYRIVIRTEATQPEQVPDAGPAAVPPAPAEAVPDGAASPPAGRGGAPRRGGQCPPDLPTTWGEPPNPRPAAPIEPPAAAEDGHGPPGCDAHPDQRRPFCPECRDVRRGGWAAGCRKHRRRRAGCPNCAPTPTPARFTPPPAPPPRTVDWRAIAAEAWTGTSRPRPAQTAGGTGPPSGDGGAHSPAVGPAPPVNDAGCPVCGLVDELGDPGAGVPCWRCTGIALPRPAAAAAVGLGSTG